MVALSRYNNYNDGWIEQLADGRRYLFRTKLVHIPGGNDRTYTVKQGDRIDTITYRQYLGITTEPEKYYRYICDVNNIANPLDLSELVGQDIIIPDFRQMQLQE